MKSKIIKLSDILESNTKCMCVKRYCNECLSCGRFTRTLYIKLQKDNNNKKLEDIIKEILDKMDCNPCINEDEIKAIKKLQQLADKYHKEKNKLNKDLSYIVTMYENSKYK